MQWFRFYNEALDDPKVQTLDGDTFKAWVNLLCLCARNNGLPRSINEISFALRLSVNDCLTVVERLSNATLLDRRNGGVDGMHYAIHGWEKRQYKSDTSTIRVKRFRNVTGNVTQPLHETVPETDTETDTETEIKKIKEKRKPSHSLLLAEFPEFWNVYPRKAGKGAAEKAWLKATRSVDASKILVALRGFKFSLDPEFIPHPATWLNQKRYEDFIQPEAKVSAELATITDRNSANYMPWRVNFTDNNLKFRLHELEKHMDEGKPFFVPREYP